MGRGKTRLDRTLFAKGKKAYARISSAVLQSWRELLLKQSNTALFEKDLELLVIASVTVFPKPNLLFLYPPVLCT